MVNGTEWVVSDRLSWVFTMLIYIIVTEDIGLISDGAAESYVRQYLKLLG